MAGTGNQCTQRIVLFHPPHFTITPSHHPCKEKKKKKDKAREKRLALMLRISQEVAVD